MADYKGSNHCDLFYITQSTVLKGKKVHETIISENHKMRPWEVSKWVSISERPLSVK